ncbi:hypothetical protein KC332_g11099 [Hortaea werneckii]|uniref:DNA recombination and repair protein Rad51-like C-terminal domain-containing protein n=2 Tax=Hortaea werneckii TaxID=91943 RepID=A0A3M7IM48_HORWE|nr:hypothetical protein KC358_g8560 [Hortaea werneckii]OTA30590.1 hypothetical protein BTJ68_10330 [Hortaea werneckii EXF-2000]KAI6836055.1 hypothetical protein KC350_g6381 [Hortaea werneckii]KAI6916904.1 hypothetical protein KC348_g11358 [Hortaea werneckii]KAI6929464.1 hypothetical protein KC341_g10838 [Hortaea werneckii]
MAEDLGKTLLAEVEEVGLDELLNTLRTRDDITPTYFGLSQLDRLIRTIVSSNSAVAKGTPPQPMVELTSTASGGGKTHILYCLTALAVCPKSSGGREACVVIFDTDGTFSVDRLAQQIRKHLTTNRTTSNAEEHPDTDVDDIIFSCLKHVHIFRPQSLASTIRTLEDLPSHLFDQTRHHSYDRVVGFIALDSASTFHWQTRSDEEEAALLASTEPHSPHHPPSSKPPNYQNLATALRKATQTFSCPAIFTSRHLAPTPHPNTQGTDPRSLRPPLPAPLSQLPLLRLVVQRKRVRKFPVGMSITEALHEADARQRAVEEGRFECVVNEWGMDERTVERLLRSGGGGIGWGFRIGADGMEVEFDGQQGEEM